MIYFSWFQSKNHIFSLCMFFQKISKNHLCGIPGTTESSLLRETVHFDEKPWIFSLEYMLPLNTNTHQTRKSLLSPPASHFARKKEKTSTLWKNALHFSRQKNVKFMKRNPCISGIPQINIMKEYRVDCQYSLHVHDISQTR